MSTFSFDKLMRSLQANEVRINRTMEYNEEKSFQVNGISTIDGSSYFREREKSHRCGRNYGRGRG